MSGGGTVNADIVGTVDPPSTTLTFTGNGFRRWDNHSKARVANGGSIVTAAVVIFALYHLRSGLQFLSHVATWVYVLAVAFALIVIASTGIIPGIDLNPTVHLSQFMDWLGGAAGMVGEYLWGLIP